jgi:hypothetical protein
MNESVADQDEIVLEITDKMMAAGLSEFFKEQNFENDWEVVARIYAAMRKAEIQTILK